MGEPYYLSFDQILKLTPYQVRHVLYRPKSSPRRPKSPEEIFWIRGRARGLPEEEIRALWEKHKPPTS